MCLECSPKTRVGGVIASIGNIPIDIGYGNQGSATFAFECDTRFADEYGYVQDYKVLTTAWNDFLHDPPGNWRINYKQPNAVENWLHREGLILKNRQRS